MLVMPARVLRTHQHKDWATMALHAAALAAFVVAVLGVITHSPVVAAAQFSYSLHIDKAATPAMSINNPAGSGHTVRARARCSRGGGAFRFVCTRVLSCLHIVCVCVARAAVPAVQVHVQPSVDPSHAGVRQPVRVTHAIAVATGDLTTADVAVLCVRVAV